VIPFTFNRIAFNGCTTYTDDDNRAWCSTKTLPNGVHISGHGYYGHCNSECPIDIEGTRGGGPLPVSPWLEVSLSLVTVLILLVVFTLCLYHREKIFIWLYSNPQTRALFLDDPVGKDLPNDVFVSYAHQDAEFVEQTIVPGLEESSNIRYKCLVHVRDFVPGKNISEQIMEAVDMSRKTLVCLSKNFVSSEWANLEFEMAHSRKRVVLVFLPGPMPTKSEMSQLMHEYISANTYLDAANDPWFWEKLRYALPHKGRQQVIRANFLGMRTRWRVHPDQIELGNPSTTQVKTTLQERQTENMDI